MRRQDLHVGGLAVRAPIDRYDSDAVEVAIGGRKLGPMVLTEVRCGREDYRPDIAVLVFRRAGGEGGAST